MTITVESGVSSQEPEGHSNYAPAVYSGIFLNMAIFSPLH